MSKNKKYYWLKLKEDFFDDKIIKYLRKLPDGNGLIVIYLKMQLKSLKTEGFLKYDKLLPTCEEELALVLDEDPNLIRFAITALEKVGAVERWENDTLYMASMQQLIGSETAVAERVRRHRALKSKKQEVLQCNTQTLPSNIDVTNGNTEIEIDKDIELEIDKDIELEIEKDIELEIEKDIEKSKQKKKKKSNNSSELSSSSSSQLEQVINSYHEICTSLTKVRSVTDDRKRAIKTLLTKMSINEIKEAFTKAENTPFLKGENDRGWKANIDFMLKHVHLVKILEGFYDSNKKDTSYGPSYNISEYEKYSIFDDNENGNKNKTNTDWWNKTI